MILGISIALFLGGIIWHATDWYDEQCEYDGETWHE